VGDKDRLLRFNQSCGKKRANRYRLCGNYPEEAAAVIRQYLKGADIELAPHFALREFDCHCADPKCNRTYVSQELVSGLWEIRNIMGPVKILSGFRCKTHNAEVGGKADSKHLLGIAADISGVGLAPEKIKRAAQRITVFSIGGIGVYPWGVHLDVRGTSARWIG